VPLAGVRRQTVRLERESRHLGRLGAELLDLCDDALARGKAKREGSAAALDQATRALSVARAAAGWS
jgi:hypothetical protein